MSNFASMDNLIQHLNARLSLTDTPPHPNVDASSATKSLRCDICNRELSTEGNLRRHVADRHSAPLMPRFACTACEKSFRRPFDLDKHVARSHSILGVPAPKVAACQSGHRAERLRDKHCTWPGCDSAFSRTANLKAHVYAVHLPIRDHACPFAECTRGFSRKFDLSHHIQAHHTRPGALVMGPKRQLETGGDEHLPSGLQGTVSCIESESVSGPSE